MLNFDLNTPTRLLFGKDAQSNVGQVLKPYTKKLLLHYGTGSIKKSGLYDEVVASLKENDIDFVELGGVVPNPRLSLVYEGIRICKENDVDFILAVGGGSVIDSAKMIAMGFYFEGDAWDILEKHIMVDKALPVATVLTIPAAGSEASGGVVITNEEKQMKVGYDNDVVRPVVSFMNPELFYTLPKNQIANGVADMMSHVFERYFTNTKNTDITDGLCEAVLRTIIKFAPKVYANPQSYEDWCEVGFGGTMAHTGLVGMGREQDWGCHDMEHELSAIYDVAHGAGLAVLTPAWMEYVYKENVEMFVQFAVNVMDVRENFRDPDAMVKEAIARLRAVYRRLELPGTLGELGIDDTNLELMAKKATGEAYGSEHSLGGFKKLYWQDVLNIYNLAK